MPWIGNERFNTKADTKAGKQLHALSISFSTTNNHDRISSAILSQAISKPNHRTANPQDKMGQQSSESLPSSFAYDSLLWSSAHMMLAVPIFLKPLFPFGSILSPIPLLLQKPTTAPFIRLFESAVRSMILTIAHD